MKNIKRKQHKVDATGKTVGRLATQIANLLRGKNKTEFEHQLDLGDIVEVYNIKKLKFTGKKMEQKRYYRYSGYPGGLKEKKINDLWKTDPAQVLRRAVRDMMPDNKLRNNMLKRLIIKQ